MYGSLTFLPHSNFAIFDGWYFLQYCSQRAENCTNCPTLSALSTFAFNSYIRPRLLWVKSYGNEEKCKQWRQQRFAYREVKHQVYGKRQTRICNTCSHNFLSIRIVLSCFYLLMFCFEKFSTWIWRLPFTVYVKLKLPTKSPGPGGRDFSQRPLLRTRPLATLTGNQKENGTNITF